MLKFATFDGTEKATPSLETSVTFRSEQLMVDIDIGFAIVFLYNSLSILIEISHQ